MTQFDRPRIMHVIAPAVLLLVFMLPLRDGFTDDGYIHIQYARNLVEHGEYSFNQGYPSFGTTSPLWVLDLAVMARVFGTGEGLIEASRLLSWLAGFAALVGVYYLAIYCGVSAFGSMLATLVFAADPWFARWTALSMETSAAVAAVIVLLLASTRAFENRRAAGLMGVFIAVAALLRPEVYLVAVVYPIVLLSRWRKVDRSLVWYTVVIASLLLIPWLWFARVNLGSFLPNTAGAKSGGLILSPVLFFRKLEPVAKIIVTSQGLTAAVLSIALFSRRSREFITAPRTRFVLAWMLALPVAYVVLDIQILSRYLLLVTPAICVLGWGVLERLTSRRRYLILAAALTVVMNAWFYIKVVVPPSRAFTADLRNNLKSVGQYIHDNTASDAVVAAADIGYLAFYSQRRILDLGGLVEPGMGALLSEYDYEQIVDDGMYLDIDGYPHVDYFVDRVLEPARFDGSVIAGHRFDRVYLTAVRNLGIRKPGPYYYTIYKLTREN